MANDKISQVTLPNGTTYDIEDIIARQAIPFGQVDSTSTSTAFTATVPGITELKDGVIMLLKNGVITSASGFTININGLGAKPVYSNMAAATRETTLFNVNYTLLFIYDEDRVSGGCWINYRGYYSDANSVGYQLRTASSTLPMTDIVYRYRLLFTNADNTKWVPANKSSSTNATSKRDTIQTPINPFGPIVYYGTTSSVAAGSSPAAGNLWQQYTITLGYSFNRTGAALVLQYPKPIYLKCSPQSDGSAIIDADTPYVQALPSTEDGKIYIYLGIAFSATSIELRIEHPVYWHDGTGIRRWTGSATAAIDVDSALSSTSENPVQNKVIYSALGDKADASSIPVAATATPLDNGTAAVGTSTKYAREDHVHPKELYWCTYDTTTLAEIKQAIADGKLPVVRTSSDTVLTCTAETTNRVVFSCAYLQNVADGGITHVEVRSTGWSTREASMINADSPALTGVPTAPTAVAGTDTTQIATTAYVQGELNYNNLSNKPSINNTTLSGNMTLTAADIGAMPDLSSLALSDGSIPYWNSSVWNCVGFDDVLDASSPITIPLIISGSSVHIEYNPQTLASKILSGRKTMFMVSDGSTYANIYGVHSLDLTNGHLVLWSLVPVDGDFNVCDLYPDPNFSYEEMDGTITAYNKIDAPSSPSNGDVLTYNGSAWVASTKPTYTASEVGALPDTTVIPSKTSDLTNDSGFITGMFIGSYGHSTYAEVLAAYQANKVVYCRASSAADPSSGNQLRMAFLAYVNNQTTPTEFEFQYYRSVTSHSDTQQGDQVFIYKLNSSGTWSVTTREAYTKMSPSTGLTKSYSSGTLTFSVTNPLPALGTAGYFLKAGASGPEYSALTSSEITTVLGYTPYDSDNPQGFTDNIGTITGIKVNSVALSIDTDGTIAFPNATTSAYGIVQLSNSTSSTSDSLAATASAVKAAYDNGGVQSVNSYTGAVTLSHDDVGVYQGTTAPSSMASSLNTGDIYVYTPGTASGSTYTLDENMTFTGDITFGGTVSGLTAEDVHVYVGTTDPSSMASSLENGDIYIYLSTTA